jgi:hypothetical protein
MVVSTEAVGVLGLGYAEMTPVSDADPQPASTSATTPARIETGILVLGKTPFRCLHTNR